jgi:hypothetical protein
MRRFSLPALASVSVLALGLVPAGSALGPERMGLRKMRVLQ